MATPEPAFLHGDPPLRATDLPLRAPSLERPGLMERAPGPDDLFDWSLLRDWAGFVRRAPRRHPRLALGAFLATVGLAGSSLWALPWTYRVESRILAERNLVMPALGNPRRAVPLAADAPTRAAAETVLRRDNLVALVTQTQLIGHWRRTRAPALRVKDWILELIHPLDEDETLEAMVGVLEKKLMVRTDESTVAISIEWPDAQTAFQLVDLARQNFLESRHAAEVATIAEAISILEAHAQATARDLEALLAEQRTAKDAAPSPAPPPAASAPAPAADPVARGQLKALISAKRSALAELEAYRSRRLAELQTQLAEQKASFGPAHPSIVAATRSIEALSRDSGQVLQLKKEEQELVAEFVRTTGHGPDEKPAAPAVPRPANFAGYTAPAPADAATEYARARLKAKTEEQQELLDRIAGARIELDTARAAFKYRYTIIKPAQVPRKAVSPVPAATLLVGVLLGAIAAFLAAVARDLRGGLLVEPWQVERAFGLPVLGITRRRE